MKYLATLFILMGLAVLPLHAQDGDDEPVVTKKTAGSAAKDGKSAAELKQENRDAMRMLTDELKDRTHMLALLKKVKDQKSADKIGKQLVKEYGKSGRSTAMGATDPTRKFNSPAVKECSKKFSSKFKTLNDGIQKQIKRIADLDLESSDLDEGLEALPPLPAFLLGESDAADGQVDE